MDWNKTTPVTYDISRLWCWAGQVGGPFSQPQDCLPNQLDDGIGPSSGSSCSGILYAETSTSAAEQGAISSSTLHCWRLACHNDISEAWRGRIPRGISNIIRDDIRGGGIRWGSCLDCADSIGGQPAGDVAINIVRCCRTRVSICGPCTPELSHQLVVGSCSVSKKQWILVWYKG